MLELTTNSYPAEARIIIKSRVVSTINYYPEGNINKLWFIVGNYEVLKKHIWNNVKSIIII